MPIEWKSSVFRFRVKVGTPISSSGYVPGFIISLLWVNQDKKKLLSSSSVSS
jgi:hypothetical protein